MGTKIERSVDIGMAPFSLLFDVDERVLRASFKLMPFAELGIYFGDGSTPDRGSGTLIYRGAAFDNAIEASEKPTADHEIFCGIDLGAIR